MRFSFDRIGFPLIGVPRVGLYVQLLPVTKVQFERFITEPNEFGDGWYEEILAVNPRVSYRQLAPENREGVFAIGLLPEEALSFARWMGDGFRVPTIEEWRGIYTSLERERIWSNEWETLLSQCKAHGALILLEQLMKQIRPNSWLDYSLMHGGLVEWVINNGRWVGLGAPRSEFYPSLWNPLADVVSPLNSDLRLPYFGLRLVQRVA